MSDPVTLTGQDGLPYLAVDVQPDAGASSFVLDVSELDGFDLLGWAADDSWLNVVCDVQRVSLHRGFTRLQGVTHRAEAGSAEVSLMDTLRRFDPMANADAIHRGTPLRVRAWSYHPDTGERWDAVLFTGTVEDVPVSYPKEGPPLVTVTATDLIGTLSSWTAQGRPDPGVGAGDDLLERAYRILGEMNLPASLVAEDSDTVYAATLPATSLTSARDDLAAAEEAELGRVWPSVANRLVIRGRDSELSGPVRGTLSDLHGEEINGAPHCCIADLDAALGPEGLANRVVASRRIPQEKLPEPVDRGTVTDAEWQQLQFYGWRGRTGDKTERLHPPELVTTAPVLQVDDTVSQARYGVRSVDRRSLELQTDQQVQDWAVTVLSDSSTPELRIDSVTPSPAVADLDSALRAWPAVCATDLGDRWLLRYRPQLGPQVARTVGVLGIGYELTPDAWTVNWTTTPAPTPGDDNPGGWFLLDVSDLDSDDLLAPFRSTGLPEPATYEPDTNRYNLTATNLDATAAALAAGALRVLTVGDSITYGQGATDRATDAWPALLPGRLADAGFPGTTVLNAGISGSTTGDWLNSPLPAGHVDFAPTVTTIALGTNDAAQGVPVSTYAANLDALVRRYQGLGEVLLVVPIPLQALDLSSTYVAAVYKVAAARGVPLLDAFQRWGSYPARQAQGWYADSTHPTTAGYADLATAVAGALLPPSLDAEIIDGGSPAVATGDLVDGGAP